MLQTLINDKMGTRGWIMMRWSSEWIRFSFNETMKWKIFFDSMEREWNKGRKKSINLNWMLLSVWWFANGIVEKLYLFDVVSTWCWLDERWKFCKLNYFPLKFNRISGLWLHCIYKSLKQSWFKNLPHFLSIFWWLQCNARRWRVKYKFTFCELQKFM